MGGSCSKESSVAVGGESKKVKKNKVVPAPVPQSEEIGNSHAKLMHSTKVEVIQEPPKSEDAQKGEILDPEPNPQIVDESSSKDEEPVKENSLGAEESKEEVPKSAIVEEEDSGRGEILDPEPNPMIVDESSSKGEEPVKENSLGAEESKEEVPKSEGYIEALGKVKEDAYELENLGDEYRKEPEIVLAAVESEGHHVLEYAHKELFNNLPFVLQLVRVLDCSQEWYSEQLHVTMRGNRDVVLRALAKDAHANSWKLLEGASEEIRKDKEIMLAAVTKSAEALKFAHSDMQKDRDVVLAAVRSDGKALKYAAVEIRADKDVVMEALKMNGKLSDASDELRKNPEVAIFALDRMNKFDFVHEDLHGDREFILTALNADINIVRHLSEEFLNDKEIVGVAVSKFGEVLEYASDELKKDKEIVLAAVKRDGNSISSAAEELQKDKEVVIAAVSQNGAGEVLEDVCDDLKSDREVALAAVSNDPGALGSVGDAVDKEMAMIALKRNGFECMKGLREISRGDNGGGEKAKELLADKEVVFAALDQEYPEVQSKKGGEDEDDEEELESCMLGSLSGDKEVALYAVKKRGLFLEHVCEELKGDKEVVLAAVRSCGLALEFASDELKKDKEVIVEAAKENYDAMEYVDESLLKDSLFIFQVVKENGLALNHAADELKENRDLVLEACKNDGSVLLDLDEKFYGDEEIMKAAVKSNGKALECASEEFIKNNRDVIMEGLKRSGQAYEYCAEHYPEDREMCLVAVKNKGSAIEFASDKFKEDKELAMLSVKQDGRNLGCLTDTIRGDREIVMEATKTCYEVLCMCIDSTMEDDREMVLACVKLNGKAIEYAADRFVNDREIVSEAVKTFPDALDWASSELQCVPDLWRKRYPGFEW